SLIIIFFSHFRKFLYEEKVIKANIFGFNNQSELNNQEIPNSILINESFHLIYLLSIGQTKKPAFSAGVMIVFIFKQPICRIAIH
ncbi:hypothetical protein P8786_23530, partial [Bacillus subtilis]|uniref:hypothetical protein n=1 Tax=Bacillus subtilis TaxID=1423 RepID=UPI002DBEEDAA